MKRNFYQKYAAIFAILALVSLTLGCATDETPVTADHTVKISGLIDGELTLSDLKVMESETFDATLVKSTGTEIPGNYTGVRLTDVLNQYGVQPEYISFVAMDGYMITLTENEYLGGYLCYAQNGESLTLETGGPVRLVIPDQPAKLWLSYLEEIKLLDSSNALIVTGKTNVTIVLAPEDLARFQKKTIEAEFRGEMGTYTGVPLVAILDRARYLDDAESVEFIAADGFSRELPFEEVYANEDILVSEELRLIMPGYAPGFWVSDLRRIEVK